MAQGLIVAVTGGRDFENYKYVAACLAEFHAKHTIGLIIEGGARGWDFHCRNWAHYEGIQVITYWANWVGHGRSAGHLRNKLMLEKEGLAWLILGPGGPGTANMREQAKAKRIPIWECVRECSRGIK